MYELPAAQPQAEARVRWRAAAGTQPSIHAKSGSAAPYSLVGLCEYVDHMPSSDDLIAHLMNGAHLPSPRCLGVLHLDCRGHKCSLEHHLACVVPLADEHRVD